MSATDHELARAGPWRWEITRSALEAGARLVALTMGVRMDADGSMPSKYRVGVRRIAADAGVSKSTAARYLALLIEGGWLVEVEAPMGRRPGLYRASLPAVASDQTGHNEEQASHIVGHNGAVASDQTGHNEDPPSDVVSHDTDGCVPSEEACVPPRQDTTSTTSKNQVTLSDNGSPNGVTDRLVEQLRAHVEGRLGRRVRVDQRTWQREIVNLITVDRVKPDTIEAVIAWLDTDAASFWRDKGLITNARDLRERFDRLDAQRIGTPARTDPFAGGTGELVG